MAIEVRDQIIFSPDEVRSAIISFVVKQGQAATANEVMGVEVTGPNEAPIAVCSALLARLPKNRLSWV